MKTQATIVADSIAPVGNHRMTSTLDVFPRIILAEVNTHKMLSKNSASSRAIKLEKMINAVKGTPFIPSKWMKDHPGMQGSEYLDLGDSWHANNAWLVMRDKAIEQIKFMHNRYGITKQLLNRWLEPAMYHTALISGTEWENFFALRAHKDAEIHMQELACAILDQMNASVPKSLKEGEWHIPFGDIIDPAYIDRITDATFTSDKGRMEDFVLELLLKASVARNAKTSYTSIHEDGKPDLEKDVRLHDRLLANGHFSPFEHTARAMSEEEYYSFYKTIVLSKGEFDEYDSLNTGDTFQVDHTISKGEIVIKEFGWCHNLRGFRSYRSLLPNENKRDQRLKKHVHEKILLQEHTNLGTSFQEG